MTTLSDNFWAKVDKDSPASDFRPDLGTCWLWTNAVQSRGYGSVSIDGKVHLTHRLAYVDANGAIPAGLTVDHLCMNKRCVRPSHLEAVTSAENSRRARVAAGYFIGGQCGKGHRLTDDSTRLTKRGRLCCKACEEGHRRAHILKSASDFEPTTFEIRDWALANGIAVSTRGRLPKSIRAAYLAAHEQAAA